MIEVQTCFCRDVVSACKKLIKEVKKTKATMFTVFKGVRIVAHSNEETIEVLLKNYFDSRRIKQGRLNINNCVGELRDVLSLFKCSILPDDEIGYKVWEIGVDAVNVIEKYLGENID